MNDGLAMRQLGTLARIAQERLAKRFPPDAPPHRTPFAVFECGERSAQLPADREAPGREPRSLPRGDSRGVGRAGLSHPPAVPVGMRRWIHARHHPGVATRPRAAGSGAGIGRLSFAPGTDKTGCTVSKGRT
jgi:hypothetical protein